MKKYLMLCTALSLCYIAAAEAFTVSPQNASIIGERIWKNECAGTIEGLTNWKKGENFPSLGIGHFIWYQADKKELFQETFPEILKFLEKEGAIIPDWLKSSSGCPWTSREEFNKDMQSPKMKSLRQFLFNTRSLQALFMAKRLEDSLPIMIKDSSKEEKEKITANFYLLSKDAKGLYALLDYLNFKGSGASTTESYKGQGWGLRQVLQSISPSSQQPLVDFVEAAKSVLKQRVQNSPPERKEEQWLKGWFNRLDTYLQP
jgi:hypothetical protein